VTTEKFGCAQSVTARTREIGRAQSVTARTREIGRAQSVTARTIKSAQVQASVKKTSADTKYTPHELIRETLVEAKASLRFYGTTTDGLHSKWL